MKVRKSSARGIFLPRLARDQQRTPLFLQIYATLRKAILEGQLPGGTRLPSTRTLARDLKISRTTGEEAFGKLLAEGFVERRIGAGTFVASIIEIPASRPLHASRRTPSRRLAARTSQLARHACFPSAAMPRAFSGGTAAIETFPLDTWRTLMARSMRGGRHSTLGSSDPAGFMPLRQAVASYLTISRGVVCSAHRVVILVSSQQALDLIARLLIDPGDKVWIEEPGYPGARAALLANDALLVPVQVDEQGLRVDDGLRQAPRARMAYVTPSHQYPSGVTLSLERRLALLDWSRRYDSWIVEDDYDSEFRYDARPIAAIQGMDNDDRVIYIGTFSKVMFPALRLAYVVLPQDLLDTFVIARGVSDGHPPAQTQMALAEFFSQGHFGAHVRRMREQYRDSRDTLVRAVSRSLEKSLRLGPTDAGLHTVAYLRKDQDDRGVSARLARGGIDAQPLSRYYHSHSGAAGLFLGYGALSPRQIEDGVRRMAELLG